MVYLYLTLHIATLLLQGCTTVIFRTAYESLEAVSHRTCLSLSVFHCEIIYATRNDDVWPTCGIYHTQCFITVIQAVASEINLFHLLGL
jgi:hypothetical protein